MRGIKQIHLSGMEGSAMYKTTIRTYVTVKELLIVSLVLGLFVGTPETAFGKDEAFNLSPASEDSLSERGSDSMGWRKFAIAEFSVSYGKRANVGYGSSPGFLFSMQVLPLAYGLDTFHGLGIGSSVYEAYISTNNAPEEIEDMWSTSGLPSSWFPVYLYYPVYAKRKTETLTYRKEESRLFSPICYIFAGGSNWSKPDKYLHAGITFIIDTFAYASSNPTGFGTMGNIERISDNLLALAGANSIAVQLGGFYAKDYTAETGIDVAGYYGLYLSISLIGGGIFVRD